MNRKHRFFWNLLRPIVIVFLFLRFGYRFKRARNLPENYIVLSNHTTDWDPLFVGCSFRKQMYFVASEHIARWKFAYKLINFLLAPILRYKGTVAAGTVMDIFRKLRAGNNVAIFAEGSRSWDGVTGPILPSTGKTVKSAKCGLVTYKLTGGYFVSPRWGEGLRRGHLRGEVVHIYTKEELAAMTVDEINEIICRDLYEDAYARQEQDPKPYRGKNPAQRMESLIYICPFCGAHETLISEKDTVFCSACGKCFTYDRYGFLHGTEQKTVKELLAYQKQQTARDAQENKTYYAQDGVLKKVANHIESFVAEGVVSLNKDGLSCGDVTIPVSDILDLTIHGKRGVVFSTAREYYELIPREDACAVKFAHLFWEHKNRLKG